MLINLYKGLPINLIDFGFPSNNTNDCHIKHINKLETHKIIQDEIHETILDANKITETK